MIGRNRSRKAEQDTTEPLGVTKPWRKSWGVLIGLIRSRDAQAFAKLEPRFKRAYKDYGVWMTNLKQDPRHHEAGADSAYYFRDREFGIAFRVLMAESDQISMQMSCQPGHPQYEIRQAIRELREKMPYWPK